MSKKKPTLRELVEKAAQDLDTYQCPDIDEAHVRLGELFEAAGKSNFDRVSIRRIDLYGDKLGVAYEWSARCCHQSDYDEIPALLLDADDPIKAATIWRCETEVNTAKYAVESAERAVSDARERLHKAQVALVIAKGA